MYVPSQSIRIVSDFYINKITNSQKVFKINLYVQNMTKYKSAAFHINECIEEWILCIIIHCLVQRKTVCLPYCTNIL